MNRWNPAPLSLLLARYTCALARFSIAVLMAPLALTLMGLGALLFLASMLEWEVAGYLDRRLGPQRGRPCRHEKLDT